MTMCLVALVLPSEAEASSDWRAESISGEREQPITVWPRLANSSARALPRPRLTPVIITVLVIMGAAPPTMFMALVVVGGGGAVMPLQLLDGGPSSLPQFSRSFSEL